MIIMKIKDLYFGEYQDPVELYVYKKGQMIIPTNTWVYGSDKKIISYKHNTSYVFTYHILQDEEVTLDQPIQRCHEPDKSTNISICVAHYVEHKFNCSLPLLGGFNVKNACKGMKWGEDAANAFQFVQQLKIMTEHEIFKRTGCIPSCNREKIQSI